MSEVQVKMFDIRYPSDESTSYSLFAGRSSSSVYGLSFEHSRLFGALDDDAFFIEAAGSRGGGEPVRYWEHRDPRGKLLVAGR